MVKTEEYHFGTGRRKSAVAQVRVFKGSGKIVNQSKHDLKFYDSFVEVVTEPLKMLSIESKYDISFIVNGGGVESQKTAIQLGVARAISKISEDYEKSLKKANMLSRDPREKERKKPGLKKARRAPQWAKR
jgi:small subunit ribosomal protein S9